MLIVGLDRCWWLSISTKRLSKEECRIGREKQHFVFEGIIIIVAVFVGVMSKGDFLVLLLLLKDLLCSLSSFK